MSHAIVPHDWWSGPWARLVLAFPWPVMSAANDAKRSALYREHLGWLKPAEWAAVVDAAIAGETDRSLPPVAVLLRAARSIRRRSNGDEERPAPRTQAQIEAGKKAARAGLELLRREHLSALGVAALKSGSPGVAKPMPPALDQSRELTAAELAQRDERLALLRAQAQEITR